MRRKSAAMVVVTVLTGVGSAAQASAEMRDPHTKRPAARNLDVRSGLAARTAATSAQRQAARALKGVDVTFDPATGLPSSLIRHGGAMTAKSGASAEAIARGFLADHAGLFRLTAGGLANFRVAAQDTARNFTSLTLQQTDAGRDVLGSRLTFGIDREGRLLTISGVYDNGAVAGSGAKLSPSDGVRAALRSAGESVSSLKAKWSTGGATRRTVYENTVARDVTNPSDIEAQLVTFPMPGNRAARLAWKTVTEVNKIAWYESVVDAGTGEVLSRHNLYHNAAEGTVFTAQHPAIAGATRTVVPFTGASYDDAGWVTARRTSGNNVNAYQDADGNDASDFQPETADTPDPNYQHFNYAWTNAWGTGSPPETDVTTDQAAVVTQMFYYANKYHDYLYGLVFNEASRNFQVDNFGRGGAGGDPVLAEADDDYLNAACNANFGTPGDGTSGRMQMFVGRTSCGNNSVQRAMNGDTIFHEMSHGTSHRIVSGGSLGSGSQTDAMGEGWGDFFATSYWNDPAYGDYNNGNTVRGIRSVGYDTSGLTYSDHCTPSCEEHDDGEIWATVLWAMRVKLIAKYGYSADRPDTTAPSAGQNLGNRRAEQLVVDAMKLSGTNPTFISMRDSILAADVADYANADECLIWSVFAARKMGDGATATGGQGVGTTSTDAPAQCAVTASAGGPYSTPEGTNVTLDATASTGPGLTYAWDFDNDGDFDDATGANPTFTNVGDNGVYTVKVKVTGSGGDGFSDTATTTVTVTNVNPTVNTINTNAPKPEGSPVTVDGTITDPGWKDSLTATINWGDGSGTVALAGTTENVQPDATFTYSGVSHAYGDNGTFTITVCGTDDDGGSACNTQNVTITNVAPTVNTITTTGPKPENTAIAISGTITDPGWLDTLTATVNWGDGTATVALAGSTENVAPDATFTYSNVSHTYGDDGVFTIQVCGTDDDGGSSCNTQNVSITNVAPTATIDKTGATDVNGTPVIFAHVGQSVPLKGRSTDPGSDDLTLRWNWDDGGPTIDASTLFLNNPAINPDPDPSPTINPRDVTDNKSHAFGLACAYNVGFSALDDDAGSAADSVLVLITGDPANHDKSAGFWAHEYETAAGDEIDPATLTCYLKIAGILSRVFDEVRNASTFAAARSVLNDGPNGSKDRFDRVALTNWLNFANGAFEYDELMDTNANKVPDTKFGDAMKNAETVRLNPASTDAQIDAQRKILQSFDS
jgi:hypothetical protein